MIILLGSNMACDPYLKTISQQLHLNNNLSTRICQKKKKKTYPHMHPMMGQVHIILTTFDWYLANAISIFERVSEDANHHTTL